MEKKLRSMSHHLSEFHKTNHVYILPFITLLIICTRVHNYNVQLSLEVPVMWVTVDPEMAWIALMNVQQPDTIWQNVLNYERDAVSQIKVS